MTDTPPTCSTQAECVGHDGSRVAVVGVYTVWYPLPDRKRDHPPAQQVLLKLGKDEGPYLEAWGDPRHMRPLEEIARFQGKKVRVVGRFRREMPPHPSDPPHAAALGGSCLQSVESIEEVD